MNRRIPIAVIVTCFATMLPLIADAARIDEMSLDRWAKLREVERYQLNVAEKYYREKNYKVAMAEYEKFLSLYEQSEGASYAQLKWSICLVQQKKLNTAIRDGFQSVIDYWPNAPEATAAAYLIGQTYKNMGEVRKARKAYDAVVKDHPNHLVAVYAMNDLIALASIQNDQDTKVKWWKKLTFDIKRNRESASICSSASQQLAVYEFGAGEFTDAVKALETTYKPQQMPYYIWYFARGPIAQKVSNPDDITKGHKLADDATTWIRSQVAAGSTEAAKKQALADWFVIADIHAVSKRPDKVLETYDSIQKQFGSADDVLGRLANWLKTQEKHEQARAQYAKYEDKIAGQSEIARSFRQEAKYDLAVKTYQNLVAVDQENQAQWNNEIASTYREAKKYLEAIAIYEELVKSDAENSETWIWNIAATYQQANKFKEAIGYYRQSTRFPDNNRQMAYCHRRLKQYREAIGLYGQIIGGAPKSAPWALYEIGLTYEESNQKDKAIQSLQQVCKRYPKDSYAARAHARLQSKYKISVTLGGATDK